MESNHADWQAENRKATLRRATVDEILALREEVLSQGIERISAAFDGDDAPDTLHFGAFRDGPAGTCVACVSFMASDFDGTPAWQLRGMATAPDWRGRGLGRRLLEFCESDLAAAGAISTMWCNARTHAVAFYERTGWRALGKPFDIAGVGPHMRMTSTIRER